MTIVARPQSMGGGSGGGAVGIGLKSVGLVELELDGVAGRSIPISPASASTPAFAEEGPAGVTGFAAPFSGTGVSPDLRGLYPVGL